MFQEVDHPRGATGRFTDRPRTESDPSLQSGFDTALSRPVIYAGKERFPRGYTRDAALLLDPYLTDPDPDDPDIIIFRGVPGDTAGKLQALLPEEALSYRHAGRAPKLADLLACADDTPDVFALSGYLVLPSRTDERVTVDGITVAMTVNDLHLTARTKHAPAVWRMIRDRFPTLSDSTVRLPATLARDTMPDGQPAVHVSWRA